MLHTTGGYLVYAALTHKLVFDLRDGRRLLCAADVGWVTGHSYIVYGPLANGATTVMFESIPIYPDAGRYWQIVDDLGVTIFYTAPTAIRAIAREGDSWVKRHRRTSLRILGSVGEPINPEVWIWYHDVVGDGRCAVVDTWWQTETGGILITPLPGATPTKPGSATLPFFGVEPVLVNDAGEELEGNDVSGNLCLRGSWPGQARTIWGDHKRFRETYFSAYPGLYFTGDGCRRDEDGYYWITGRVDDVLNVSGHRLGTAEVESALVAHAAVAEAAVVGFPHDIKGTGIYAYVLITARVRELGSRGTGRGAEGAGAARDRRHRHARPDRQIAPGLPKTRSGKIMRRILRKIAAGEYERPGRHLDLGRPRSGREAGRRSARLDVSRRPPSSAGESPVGGDRNRGADAGDLAEVELGDREADVVGEPGQHPPPGVDDQRMPVALAQPGIAVLAHLARCDDERLRLDRPRPHQDLPVRLAGRGGKRRRDRQQGRP